MRTRITVAVVLLAVPGLLFWYGEARCTELSCVGPFANVLVDALVVIPLLVVWLRRPSPTPLAMLVFAEIGMTVTTLRRDLDFGPQFNIVGIACGLAVGALVGLFSDRP